MNININKARAAGFIYMVVIITGMFSIAYLPQKMIDWSDTRITFNNIAARPFLFRLGIYSSVLCYVAFGFLVLLLYSILKNIHPDQARSMLILALLSVPISLNNLQHYYAALTLTGKASFLQNISIKDLQNQLMLSLHQYNNGILLVSVFWGLWLFPFGLLVYRCGFIPKTIGLLLMLGSVAYLINFTGDSLLENYSRITIGKYIRLLPAIAEISTCCWLLFFRTKIKQHAH